MTSSTEGNTFEGGIIDLDRMKNYNYKSLLLFIVVPALVGGIILALLGILNVYILAILLGFFAVFGLSLFQERFYLIRNKDKLGWSISIKIPSMNGGVFLH